MPLFKFEANTTEGKIKKGRREAADKRALRELLLGEGLTLIDAEELENGAPSKGKPNTEELSEFCRELGSMLSAGVPLVRALNIMTKEDRPQRVRAVYSELYASLQRGSSLSEAMAAQGGFPPLLISAVRASESSGQMDVSCAQMANHYEKEHRTKSKIRTAAFYPIFLLALTVVIVLVIFNFILPSFFTLFEGMELPAITQFILNLSNALQEHGLIILICFLIFAALLAFILRLPAVKLRTDRLKLRLPVIGRLLKTIYTSRFARTLSSLYSSGLTILNALQNTKDTIGNSYIASQFEGIVAEVRNGSSLAHAVASVDGFDSKLSSTIAIGEESGNLDYMLRSMADTYDYDADQAMTKLTSIIEPALIIVMAIIICFVIVAVMLPILSLYNSIGSGYSF
ncbi:MAG: type II secretion system F family protein [Oscillospiraceae bacterium]|nr:type II secretion system F family protein [Oscillospiraceae bacterium]